MDCAGNWITVWNWWRLLFQSLCVICVFAVVDLILESRSNTKWLSLCDYTVEIKVNSRLWKQEMWSKTWRLYLQSSKKKNWQHRTLQLPSHVSMSQAVVPGFNFSVQTFADNSRSMTLVFSRGSWELLHPPRVFVLWGSTKIRDGGCSCKVSDLSGLMPLFRVLTLQANVPYHCLLDNIMTLQVYVRVHGSEYSWAEEKPIIVGFLSPRNAPWSHSSCLTLTFLCAQAFIFAFLSRTRYFLKQVFVFGPEDSAGRFFIFASKPQRWKNGSQRPPGKNSSTVFICLNLKIFKCLAAEIDLFKKL